MRVYLGTTHAHTGAFNNHGKDESTPEEVFATARASGFDFFLLTEHSGPSGPADPEQFYARARQAAAESTTAGFAGLAGYEYSDNLDDGDTDRGHLTAVGTDDVVDAMAPGADFARFLTYLTDQDSSRVVLAGFNHPPPSGHGASRPSLLTPATRRVVALTETHNHERYRRAREKRFYAAMLAELDRGWRVAPTCGLDSHGLPEITNVETSEISPCRTGILAPGLTPADVLAALRARRTFASRDMNLRVRYSANGRWMGASLGAPRRVRFEIRAADPDVGRRRDGIRRLDVVGTHGRVLASRRFSGHRVLWRPQVPRRRNSYMFVRAFTRNHRTATALAAPVWMRSS
jgi:hypothetical protein